MSKRNIKKKIEEGDTERKTIGIEKKTRGTFKKTMQYKNV